MKLQLGSLLVAVALTACAGGGGSLSNAVTPPLSGHSDANGAAGAQTLYVMQYSTFPDAPQVFEYSAASSGAVSPSAILSDGTGNTSPTAITTDANGDVFVAYGHGANSTGEIAEYAAGSSGAATPLRTIFGGNTIAHINAIAVGADGSVYVEGEQKTGCPSPEVIAVYGPDASGAAPPLRVISGANTLFAASPIAVDTSGNVYVSGEINAQARPDAVLTFGPTANGNVAPDRILTGSKTQLDGILSLAITPNNQLAVFNGFSFTLPSTATVTEYPLPATGDVAPTLSFTPQAPYLLHMAVDGQGNFWFDGAAAGNALQAALYEFVANASGAAVPIRSITTTGPTAGPGPLAVH